MKALTISQPYASLIAHGEKWVENRTWPTSYRGPLAIHAGKRSRYLEADELKGYPTGQVIATCKLVACVHLPTIRIGGQMSRDLLREAGFSFSEFLEHEHTEGPWCWVLAEVDCFPRGIPAVGRQGLWDWTETWR